MQVQAFADQCNAHQDEETQGQHLDGRVLIDKFTDRPGREHHDQDRDDNRNDNRDDHDLDDFQCRQRCQCNPGLWNT